MGNLILPLAIVIGAFIIAYAIDRLNYNGVLNNMEYQDWAEKVDRLNTISNITSSLITGALFNPKYLRVIEEADNKKINDLLFLIDREESRKKKDKIKLVEEQPGDYDIFRKDRKRFIELARDIYEEISIEEKKHP